MTSVFDGLADVMTGADTGFGEATIYIPIATGIAVGEDGTINAVWTEVAILEGGPPQAGGTRMRCDVLATDVPAPAEGDTVTRVSTGETFTVVPPIDRDGIGMISLALSEPD